jgi:hypothetical protein
MQILLNFLSLNTISYGNMNGDIYGISNPNTYSKNPFPTVYEKINSSYEFFDVYSPPITSRYAEVYWTMMPKVELPEKIVNRFNGKIMAIVGYETDQVFPNGTSVPITWAYNHHYEAYIRSVETDLIKVETKAHQDYGQYNHGSKELWKPNITGPLSFLFFSEANGGEFRQSFHGYPRNYAQLIRSPRFFNIQPMQIDTRNRDPKYINQTKFVAGILPKEAASPPNAVYSGLLECPCTTRIHKEMIHSYGVSLDEKCARPVFNESICLNISRSIGGIYNSNISRVNTSDLPSGCSYDKNLMGETTYIYINNFTSNIDCMNDYGEYLGEITRDSNTNVTVQFNMTATQFILTMKGNSNNWFGIAFGAHTMSDLPYSIIVDGYGKVFEQKLGNHDQGKLLKTSINVKENIVIGGIRTVQIIRNNEGINSDYYSFSADNANIPILLAVGSTPDFKYHKFRGTNTLYLSALGGRTCVCDDGHGGSINGLNFVKNCLPEPYGDLLLQRNPTCFIGSYQGGLSCCHHKNVLLDADQVQPTDEMTYQLKFRFWFQELSGHKKLERFYYQTEAYAGEYDIPKCEEGTPPEDCIHSITAHFQGRDMIDKNIIGNNKGFKLIYLAPHCHAPTCIDMELYNADTGDLICNVNGDLGKGTEDKYDEEGYIKLNPCLFGEDEGLLEPYLFKWDTNFTSIKRNNNTNAHYGEMASWQMRGILI